MPSTGTTGLPANVTIVDLPVATSPLQGDEIFEAVQTTNSIGNSVQVSMTAIANYVGTTVVALLPAQASHFFLAGPTTGTAIPPVFRAIGTADLPSSLIGVLTGSLIGNGSAAISAVAFTTAGLPYVSAGSLTAPTWTAIATTSITGIFGLVNGGVGTNTLGTGVIVGNTTATLSIVAATTLGSIFVSQGTTTQPAFTTTPVLNSFMTLNFTSAIPSAGSSTIGLRITSAAALGLFVGNGTPTLSAGTGSIYLRTDGSNATSRLYSNTNGATGWTSILATG